jgi:signal transduction histidine kinase
VIRPYRTGLDAHTAVASDVPPSLSDVWVDRTLIARALTNLVENSLQAMPDGGTLRVTGVQAPSAVRLTFTDTGVGMDAEAVSRAFEPYFSTKTAGSGLGLANAKRNIELCGGSIAIASQPGAGTTLTVTLPSAARPAAGERGSTPSR